MKIAKKCDEKSTKPCFPRDCFTVRVPLGCNGALVAIQRRARCTMTAAPLRLNGALTARKNPRFWVEKAAF